MSTSIQEPHPLRMTAENAARRQARLDTLPPNIFENLNKLRPFVEVGQEWFHVLLIHLVQCIYIILYYISIILCGCVNPPQVVSDGLSLVQAVVPKNQNRSFIIQGSDILVKTKSKPKHSYSNDDIKAEFYDFYVMVLFFLFR